MPGSRSGVRDVSVPFNAAPFGSILKEEVERRARVVAAANTTSA
jgi:hypothetical protein